MNGLDICKAIQSSIGEQFACTEHNDYLRIRTPYLYPDGDNIDLFCKVEGDTVTVTDLAETAGWLCMQSSASRRSLKQNRLIDDICMTHGVEFKRGMLLAHCRESGELSATVTRVAQAALRVSDLWFTFQNRAVESVADEVADYLTGCALEYERPKKLIGRSMTSWTVDFHVQAPARSSLIYVLSTGNRSAARRVTDHVVAAWFDLSHLAAPPKKLRFVSLFDDAAGFWDKKDFNRAEQLSAVALWSRRDAFAEMLTAAD